MISSAAWTPTLITSLVIVCALLATPRTLGASAMEPAPGVFFVALNGDDNWSGTLPAANRDRSDGPFQSLARAQQAVRAAEPSRDRKVVLRAGTYYLSEPLVLGPEDSGTAEHPVTYMAYPGEKVIVSGGRPLTDWHKREKGVWATKIQADWGLGPLRQLRCGEEAQTLARHPNAVPDEPYTGGWLFAKARDLGAGTWGGAVGNIHTPGDWIEWHVEVPAAGQYQLWLYYGAQNQPFGRTDMAGQTVFQVDGGEDVVLDNLPDTGGWNQFKWSRCAVLSLPAGKHTLRWVNRKGGGINFDAFALCTDPDWTPVTTDLPAVAQGHHLLVVHAEAYSRAQGKEMTVSVSYLSKPDQLPFAAGDIPEDWNLDNAQVFIFPAWGWVGGPMGVTGIDRDKGLLFLANTRSGADIRLGNRYYLQNVRDALDQPGEFYVDDKAGEVLYLPAHEDFQERGMVAPIHDRVVHLRGDRETDTWVEHIHLRGLTFHDTTYSLAIESFYTQPEGAVWLDHARGCVVEDCTFSLLGGYGVHLVNGATACKVLGCRMFELGGGGVLISGDTTTQPTNCVVAGCHIHHIGRVYKHCAGVYVTTGSGHRVAFNTITDVPRYGISFKSYGPTGYSHNNVAEYNEILRSNLETNDTGAIETLGRDRQLSGNIIRYNLILDVVGMKHTDEGGIITPYFTWGIYLDDYSSGTTIVGNIVARTVRGSYHNHLGFDNVVENNVFVDGQLYQFEYNGAQEMRRNVFRRNVVAYDNADAAYCRSSGWNREVLAECDYNVVHWTGGDLASTDKGITPEGPWAKWTAAGFDTHSVIGDPLFVDAEHDDYRLRPDSPALRLGFQPIPVERIGLKGYDAAAFR
ncbi:MAG: right-handed parallel beta-helix repeat-containing protein [Armatimonadota bacterium]